MNSEDFKCNTCGDYVGEEGVWGLCDTCFDKEGGNEALAKSMEWSWVKPTRTEQVQQCLSEVHRAVQIVVDEE